MRLTIRHCFLELAHNGHRTIILSGQRTVQLPHGIIFDQQECHALSGNHQHQLTTPSFDSAHGLNPDIARRVSTFSDGFLNRVEIDGVALNEAQFGSSLVDVNFGVTDARDALQFLPQPVSAKWSSQSVDPDGHFINLSHGSRSQHHNQGESAS